MVRQKQYRRHIVQYRKFLGNIMIYIFCSGFNLLHIDPEIYQVRRKLLSESGFGARKVYNIGVRVFNPNYQAAPIEFTAFLA